MSRRKSYWHIRAVLILHHHSHGSRKKNYDCEVIAFRCQCPARARTWTRSRSRQSRPARPSCGEGSARRVPDRLRLGSVCRLALVYEDKLLRALQARRSSPGIRWRCVGEGAGAVAQAAPKGNDQVRFEHAFQALGGVCRSSHRGGSGPEVARRLHRLRRSAAIFPRGQPHQDSFARPQHLAHLARGRRAARPGQPPSGIRPGRFRIRRNRSDRVEEVEIALTRALRLRVNGKLCRRCNCWNC